MGLIIYELNEVPKKLFDFYSNSHPNSAFAHLRNFSTLFETETADVGSLSPWITWPTMHRGVSNVEHEISDLGQDLTSVNREFPNVTDILAKAGVKVGVFGSLQSYPIPTDLDNYAFYVPDTFAAGDECFPQKLTSFQAFNLSMVRANGRNVSAKIAVKDAMKFIQHSISLGLKPTTFLKLSNQILKERFISDRVVRRRTSQVEIAFDLYMQQLSKTKPDVSFFFTNHVASSMHRYWPTVFPEDYEIGKFEKSWLERWSGEIPHAVKVANYQLNQLVQYCHVTGSELIVCSSMGQGAVTDVQPVEKQVLITNLKCLLTYLGLAADEWEPRLSMAPRVVFKPLSMKVWDALKRLDDIQINDSKIEYFKTSTGDVRLDINLMNQLRLEVNAFGIPINPDEIGIKNVDLQDASGSYAYHIPEGILLYYNANMVSQGRNRQDWKSASSLEFAPSILKKFKINKPTYMVNAELFEYKYYQY